MDIRPKAFVPFVHVADVPRSIAFYEKLGFEVRATHPEPEAGPPVWASLMAERVELMLALADVPFDSGAQAVLFYLYCEDVAGMHAHLRAQGVPTGEIAKPFYNPGGEFRVEDPDGWVILITHT